MRKFDSVLAHLEVPSQSNLGTSPAIVRVV
jgi:hypothetical protein